MSLTRVGDSDRFDGDRPVHRPHYDVFLSYNFDDGPMVRNVARRLREAGVTVWFAEDSMPSGVDWQDELSQQLMDCGSCAVFVGPTEVVGWERNEMMVAVDRATKDHEFAVFPVVLPGIDYFDPAPLPRFLALKHWVDLRAGPESATAIQELVNAIYRIPPRHPTVDRDATECPYRGLAVFEEKHARFFFGREAEVQRLSENLRRDRFVAVVGQSGVGKSSLVQAGLLPALRRGAVPGSEQWRVLLLRPGAEPAAALAARMLALQPGPGMQGTIDRLLADDRTLHRAATLALVDEPAGSGLLVIVDQFEEIFTLCRNPVEREAFVANLHHAATVSHGDTVVVLVLRADFYPRLTEFPEFAQLVQARHMLIARMSNADLRAAILEPAYEVGLGVEQGLTATILDDVEHEPGALPLLAHALLETWRHRHGGMLTVAGYQEGGGVQHGLGERAEAEYGALSDAAKAEARNIFLRLVEPGQGTADTRRRVALSEVMTGGDEPSAEVIRRFTDAWLLTTSRDDVTGESQIEISHEAVIIAWTRCARWVDDNRADLLVHRRLTVAAQEWKRRGRSPDVLYRGVPLAEAMGWRARSPMRLNWLEGDFLDAAEAQTRAQRRARRLRYTAVFAALATALVTITVVAVVAVVQRNIATSRQLAAEATKALNVDPALSLTLALRAETAAQTAQADEALRQATAESHGRAVLANPGGSVYSVRLLLDGRHAVTGSDDGAVRIWDLGQTAPPPPVAQHTGRIYTVRVSPDGRTVASVGRDGAVLLTTIATGASRVLWTAPKAVASVEFSHSGQALAVMLLDGAVHLLDAATGRERAVFTTGTGIVENASFSADDALLATASTDGTAQIWRLSDGVRLRVFTGDGPTYWVEFSPSAQMLAVAGNDGKVRLFDPNTGALLREIAVSGATLYVARFSPDGGRIAAAGLDGTVTLWDVEGFKLATFRGHGGKVFDVDFDRSAGMLVSSGNDGRIRSWAAADDVHARAPVTTATFDRSGTRVASGGTDGHLRIWRLPDLAPLLDIPDHAGRSQVVFSTDGRRLITYGKDGVVAVRDPTDGKLEARFTPDVGVIQTVASDPPDQRLVVGGDKGRIVIVDGRGVVVETLSAGGSSILSALFSPDGGSVVAGRGDGSITLWGPDRRPVTIKPSDYRAVYDIVFNVEGTLLASADASGSIAIWDPHGQQVAVLRGHEGPASAVRFRRDGKQLVSSGADGTVRVWDAEAHEELTAFQATDGSASFVDVSPDGHTILKSAEIQHALRLLTCEVCGTRDAVMQAARAHAFRPLTADEEKRFSASE